MEVYCWQSFLGMTNWMWDFESLFWILNQTCRHINSFFFFHYSRSWGRYFRMFYFPFQISNTWFQNLVNPLVLYFSLFSFINFNLWSSQMIMSACLFPLSSFLNFYILSCVYTCGLSVLQHIVYGVLVNLHCAHVFLQDVYNSPVQFVFLHVVFQVLDNSIICY